VCVTNLSQWSLALIVSFTAVGGAFGGVADLLARLQLKDGFFDLVDERVSGPNFFLALLIQMILGMCGAAAIVFVFASTTWFPREDSTQSRLWLLTLSVVAGFGARRFLPIVTRRLERQIQELEQKVEEERKEIRDTEKRSLIRDTVSRALVLLGRDSKATPTEMNVSLAVHTAFLYAKSKEGEKDLDYSDVAYNRSCYRCVSWTRTSNPVSKAEGLKDLEIAVRFNAQNGQAAREDEDFKPWWNDEEFLRVTNEPS
jgi:hypothetical protein